MCGSGLEEKVQKAIHLLLPQVMHVLWELLLQGHPDQMAKCGHFLSFSVISFLGTERTRADTLRALVSPGPSPARAQALCFHTCNRPGRGCVDISLWPLWSYLPGHIWHTGGSRQHTCRQMCSEPPICVLSKPTLNHWGGRLCMGELGNQGRAPRARVETVTECVRTSCRPQCSGPAPGASV